MKRVTKEDVIRMTRSLITRHGIRAVRVDEIAQCLGISKRTLYEFFPDKSALIEACLDQIGEQQMQRAERYVAQHADNSLRAAFFVVYEYLEDLHMFDVEFLLELRNKSEYMDNYRKQSERWLALMQQVLNRCVEAGFLLDEAPVESISGRLLHSMFESRLQGSTLKDQQQFCITMFRGCASRKGIEWIDTMRERNPGVV